MLAVCRCLLRLGFKVCSYDLLLLVGYACMQKNGFLLCSGLLLSIFASFRVCSYDLFLLIGYACMRKNGFLLCSGLLVSIFASFRVCSYDLLLLLGYACMRKMVSCCVLGCWFPSFTRQCPPSTLRTVCSKIIPNEPLR